MGGCVCLASCVCFLCTEGRSVGPQATSFLLFPERECVCVCAHMCVYVFIS